MSLNGIGALKQAAIDAYMRDLDMYDHSSYGQWAASRTDCLGYEGRTDNSYQLRDVLQRTATVSRPDGNGVGGGAVVSLSPVYGYAAEAEGPVPDFAAIFDDISGMIDQTLSPLMGLPELNGFDNLQTTLGPACKALITSKAGGGLGEGLSDPINMILSFLDDFRSEFLNAFDVNYLSRMQDAVAAYYAIGLALGAALGGEDGLWKKTDEVANTAIRQATEAFKDHSNEALTTWSEDLSVVHVMIDGIALFAALASLAVPPAGLAVITTLLAGLTFVTDAGDAAVQASQPGPSFASIMQAFEDSITGIIADTRTQEQLLDDNLLDWCRSCSDGHMSLSNQLAGKSIDSPESWPSIDVDLKRCRDVYTVYLPGIKDGLVSARTTVESLTDSQPWYRDYRRGIGHSGCWARWDELRWVLRDLLADLEWQTDKAIQVMTDIALAFEKHDQDAATQLASLSQTFNGGSGYSPPALPPDWPVDDRYHEHRQNGIGGY